ncbi:isoprenyl transferase [uncultured Megasphaera sp.]|uniref:isoprenyl transferase n=1 Tax=uncultured Megasphaera sp. TaxID=165188 RepID=UPI00259602EC|nr:isoprenyl transferase [uncultured Megasphaera sp.]
MFKFLTALLGNKKKDVASIIDTTNIPTHVAIIMDGNGRWAQRRNLPRSMGHRAGADTLKKIVIGAHELGIKVLTVYAFSTENWKRPEAEVSYIMKLMGEYLQNHLLALGEHHVRLRFIGDLSRIPDSLQVQLKEAEKNTATNDGLVLNIAINYGGRAELVQAIRNIIVDVQEKAVSPEDIKEKMVSHALYTDPYNEVDLVIRPGNDKRLSNFLLWQVAYAEFWYTPVCWPDFTIDTLREAIIAYQQRERRFGGLK